MGRQVTPQERELYEERAGICQYLGNMAKEEAEQLARKEYERRKRESNKLSG